MTPENTKDEQFIIIRDKVKLASGIDINNYRREFVFRCLSNRIYRMGLASVAEYIEFLDEVKEEVMNFCQALSVYHSEFVRDPVKYQVIKDVIIPEVVMNNMRRAGLASAGGVKTDKARLKIWCAGCAGGEEPYSMAMVISDLLGKDAANWSVSIIATDINEGLLEKARKGIYSRDELKRKGLPTAYIQQYFDDAGGDELSIKENIRQMIRFEKGDLTACRPNKGMDIIMCRNVLIYIEKNVETRIIGDFYECLNSGGYLILGNSEILDDSFFCKFRKMKTKNEFYYKKITEGSPEYREAVEKRKNILAGMGLTNGISL